MAPPLRKRKTPRPELAEKRRVAGYSQTTFARAIYASANAVRSWEQGVTVPSIVFRKPIAEVLGISMTEVDRLIGGRPPDLNGQSLNGDGAAAGLSLFVRAEQSAMRAQVVDVLRLPALLQTREYALAVERTFPDGPTNDAEIDRNVDLRVARAAALDRHPDPLHLVALIPWWVLHRTRGTRRVMVEQMTHLLELGDRPNVEIRVIPDTSDGLEVPSTFILLTSPGAATRPDVAASDAWGGAQYREHPRDIASLVDTFDRLTGESLSAGESADIIRNRRRDYRTP
jgi:transcriptional regulator with XRE-family HTH domain